jgi:hypothetical protein
MLSLRMFDLLQFMETALYVGLRYRYSDYRQGTCRYSIMVTDLDYASSSNSWKNRSSLSLHGHSF